MSPTRPHHDPTTTRSERLTMKAALTRRTATSLRHLSGEGSSTSIRSSRALCFGCGCREDGSEEGRADASDPEAEERSPPSQAASWPSAGVKEEGGIDGEGRSSLDAIGDPYP